MINELIWFVGVHIGVRESEIGIKGTGLFSILGKVVYDREYQKYRIDNPLIIT